MRIARPFEHAKSSFGNKATSQNGYRTVLNTYDLRPLKRHKALVDALRSVLDDLINSLKTTDGKEKGKKPRIGKFRAAKSNISHLTTLQALETNDGAKTHLTNLKDTCKTWPSKDTKLRRE